VDQAVTRRVVLEDDTMPPLIRIGGMWGETGRLLEEMERKKVREFIDQQKGEGMPVLTVPASILAEELSNGKSYKEIQVQVYGKRFVEIFVEERRKFLETEEQRYREEFERKFGVEWSEAEADRRDEERQRDKDEYEEWLNGGRNEELGSMFNLL
jgi:hypothetical protein